MMKLIIAGGRDFKNYNLMKEKIDFLLSKTNKKDVQIISGCANGADKLGELWAVANNVPVISFPADWKTLGKKAGFVRNAQMAEYGTHLIAFWDGQSRGTKHMIDTAIKAGLKIKVVRYNTGE